MGLAEREAALLAGAKGETTGRPWLGTVALAAAGAPQHARGAAAMAPAAPAATTGAGPSAKDQSLLAGTRSAPAPAAEHAGVVEPALGGDATTGSSVAA
mmetsp:Transcript_90886/g.203443  ORF Transcript_90886/g.203443 Transcript_90886/m.203443 type:complete len:99 (+) Transcript_90886:182-478(+)